MIKNKIQVVNNCKMKVKNLRRNTRNTIKAGRQMPAGLGFYGLLGYYI
jgi:hypothetical protein